MVSVIIGVNLVAALLNIVIVSVNGDFSVTSFLIGGNLVAGTFLLLQQFGERTSR